jgi:hypothetical protein
MVFFPFSFGPIIWDPGLIDITVHTYIGVSGIHDCPEAQHRRKVRGRHSLRQFIDDNMCSHRGTINGTIYRTLVSLDCWLPEALYRQKWAVLGHISLGAHAGWVGV